MWVHWGVWRMVLLLFYRLGFDRIIFFKELEVLKRELEEDLLHEYLKI